MCEIVFYDRRNALLDITKEQLERLANETVNEGLTVPGVQKTILAFVQ